MAPGHDVRGALDAEVARLLAVGCPGVVLRVDDGSGAAAVAGGWYAEPGGRRLTDDDPIRIASVTKTVTAVVVLRLAARGLLPLDAPIGYVLPELAGRWSDVPGHEDVGRLTLRMLLGHTSGLPDYVHSAALREAAASGPGHRWTPAELVELGLRSGPATFGPGAGWSYGDTGFVVAGLAVEAVTGRPLHEAYRRHVLDPLGMDRTWLEHHEGPRTAEPSRALVPDPDGSLRPVADVDTLPDWAGGGLVSTAADLQRLARGLHDGSVLDPGSYADITTWRPVEDPRYDAYGLGLGRTDVRGVPLVGHTGAWGAFAYAAPDRGWTVAGTVNRFGVDRRPVLHVVVNALLPPEHRRGGGR
ncbi:MAG TPA: serine hydrolase domain-containing protein [Jiangellales bacterium]|nr:serine hydrolase domain-containing protein [Jiangellales bacterium]